MSPSSELSKQQLMEFEDEIKDLFLAKTIRCPIHLSRGNEEQLLEIFKGVKPGDWCFSAHRSHYHALLHGLDPNWVREEILQGRSMHIMSAEHRFFSSSIVGGVCPIAVGVAMAIKRRREDRHVWVFLGDMAGETGTFHEASKYAKNFILPIWFVIEDNGFSVNTPTAEVWAIKGDRANGTVDSWANGGVLRYSYQRGFPHTGSGQWVRF